MASPKRRPATRSAGARRRGRLWWEKLPNEELLDVRVCDLDLSLAGSAMEHRIERLYGELDRAGLRFRPRIWISHDWFAPDGVGGFAVPFYLMHNRLMRLEHGRMFEVEGGSRTWCMRLLRHETGHALDNAYRLHWKRKWQRTFGHFSDPYRSVYVPDPASRKHVQHLDYWYSQSHPAEDFAETFAVWLSPGRRWLSAYENWPVLGKLRFVDELMEEIGQARPVVTSRARPDSISTLRYTLREYYDQKQDRYVRRTPTFDDSHLYHLFSDDPAFRGRETAASFLRRSRSELRNRVAYMTKQPKYSIDQVLNSAISRCRELRLRVPRSTREVRLDATILITIMTMHFLRGRRPEYSR